MSIPNSFIVYELFICIQARCFIHVKTHPQKNIKQYLGPYDYLLCCIILQLFGIFATILFYISVFASYDGYVLMMCLFI